MRVMMHWRTCLERTPLWHFDYAYVFDLFFTVGPYLLSIFAFHGSFFMFIIHIIPLDLSMRVLEILYAML